MVLTLYCSLEQRRTALAQLFDQVALSVLVGNGDAHLKNFGVIYEDPAKAVVKMSPAYDIVCTTCYVPNDVLALTLNSKKSLTAAMVDLEAFGKNVCKIVDPLGRIARLVHATHVVMSAHSHLIDRVRACDNASSPRWRGLKTSRSAPCELAQLVGPYAASFKASARLNVLLERQVTSSGIRHARPERSWCIARTRAVSRKMLTRWFGPCR